MERKVEAIRIKWKLVTREFQKYIAALAMVSTKITSGRKLKETGYHVMRVYCKRAGKNYTGSLMPDLA